MNPGDLSTQEYQGVKRRGTDIYQTLTTNVESPPPFPCTGRVEKHWNDVNFRLRENGTSIKTPAAKVVQNTKVKVVSYTRWTRRGPPRFLGDSSTLSPPSGNAETSLSLGIPWVSFVTKKNHFLCEQSRWTWPRTVSRLIVFP